MKQLTRSVLPARTKPFVEMFYLAVLILTCLIGFAVGDLLYKSVVGMSYNAGYEEGMAAQLRIGRKEPSPIEHFSAARDLDIKWCTYAQPCLPDPVVAKPVYGPRNAYLCVRPRSKRLRKDLRNWGYCYTDGYRKPR